jgi:hypothetical protein
MRKYKPKYLYLIKQLKDRGVVHTKIRSDKQLCIKLTPTGHFLLKILNKAGN